MNNDYYVVARSREPYYKIQYICLGQLAGIPISPLTWKEFQADYINCLTSNDGSDCRGRVNIYAFAKLLFFLKTACNQEKTEVYFLDHDAFVDFMKKIYGDRWQQKEEFV